MTTEELLAALDQRFDRIDARFENIDARFENIDARLENIDARFENIDARLENIDGRFGRLEEAIRHNGTQIDRIVGKLELVGEGVVNLQEQLNRSRDENRNQFGEVNHRLDIIEAIRN